MFIEAFCLGVLFINSQPFNGIVFNPISEQTFSQSFSPLLRCNKQHFQGTVLNSHKSFRTSCFILCDHQMFNTF